jgi:predicted nucleic acid-binding protein
VSEYVVDAAAAVDALAGKGAGGTALRMRLTQSICHAPHLLDAEVGHVLRRALRYGEIAEAEALTALQALPDLIDNRYPHAPQLIEHAWGLRHNVTFYDGLYVALARLLDVPLLTGDMRLANTPGIACRIELVR